MSANQQTRIVAAVDRCAGIEAINLPPRVCPARVLRPRSRRRGVRARR